jgi:hypothetical protein
MDYNGLWCANLIANISTYGHFHRHDLAVKTSVQYRPEVTETPLLAQQAWEMHHLVLRRRILAISGFLVGVHPG